MIRRYSARIINRINPNAVASLSCFLLILISISVGISASVQGLEMRLVLPIVFSAAALIWLLSLLGTPGKGIIVLSTVIGMFIVVFTIGRLWDEWIDIWKQLSIYFYSVYKAIIHESSFPSANPFFKILGELGNSLSDSLRYIGSWFQDFPQPSHDAKVLLWSLSLWFTVTWATWFLYRRNQPLISSIPFLVLVGIYKTQFPSSPNTLLPILTSTLALMVLISQKNRERKWDRKGIEYSQIIRDNSRSAALILSISLVASASIISSIDIQRVIEWFRERQPPAAASAPIKIKRPTEPPPVEEPFDKIESGGLPNNILINSAPELSEQVIMQVKVEEIETDEFSVPPTTRHPIYYLKSAAYEHYSSNGWSAEVENIFPYQKDESAVRKYTSNQRLIQQDVYIVNNFNGLVYVVGELAVVDTNYYVGWKSVNEKGTYFDMFGAKIENKMYRALSVIPFFGEAELRNSSQNYPDWIVNRYLQIPESVPDRVHQLAQEITATSVTPYDKAIAIESYLRTFPYSLELPPTPESVDLVDYFLFDLKTGYCDYYATSMVILARAVGLPARFTIGYLVESYDEENDYYVIYGDQAHSWVEIYFSDYGWVPFEPTTGRSPIERLQNREMLPEFEELTVEVIEEPKTNITLITVLNRILIYSLSLSVIGGIGWINVDTWIMRRQPPEKVFAKIYSRLKRFSQHIGAPTKESDTPHEFLIGLKDHLVKIAKNNPFKKLVDPAPNEIDLLIEQIIRTAYSPNTQNPFERTLAIKTWSRLRWQLILTAGLKKLSSLKIGRRRIFQE